MTKDELRKVLEATLDESGRVTPEGVVEAARDKAHPLHKDRNFHWDDDAAAAHLHRLRYAGQLIRSVPLIRRPTAQRRARVPYFVRDPRTDENESGHVPLEKIEPASDDAVIVAQDELRRVVGILKRTAAVLATLQIEGAADDLAALLASAHALQARLTEPLVMASAASESE